MLESLETIRRVARDLTSIVNKMIKLILLKILIKNKKIQEICMRGSGWMTKNTASDLCTLLMVMPMKENGSKAKKKEMASINFIMETFMMVNS